MEPLDNGAIMTNNERYAAVPISALHDLRNKAGRYEYPEGLDSTTCLARLVREWIDDILRLVAAHDNDDPVAVP